jgi:hypothetical protein
LSNQLNREATLRRIVFSERDGESLSEEVINHTIQQWTTRFAALTRELGNVARRALDYLRETGNINGARSGVGSDILFNCSQNARGLVMFVSELHVMMLETEGEDFVRAMQELAHAFPAE